MIKFNHVDVKYPTAKQKSLDDVNLEIKQGEFVAIIGLSGAGKSTLIKTINKSIDITSGELIVNDLNVSSLKGKNLRNFRKNIGMIFQSYNLVGRTSVINNVLLSRVTGMNVMRSALGLFTRQDKIDALEALDKLNILDKAYIRADQLSGGQQQRVALARTICQNPEIILADEPVAALDPVSANQVMQDFKRINQDFNITVLINIHHVELALKYTDRVIGIREGKIVYDGPSSEVNQDVLKTIYGDNYTPEMLGK